MPMFLTQLQFTTKYSAHSLQQQSASAIAHVIAHILKTIIIPKFEIFHGGTIIFMYNNIIKILPG